MIRQVSNVIGPQRFRFGPYEADTRTQELWKHGTRVKLVGQPFAILEVLLTKPGELVTREELRSRLWPGETFVDFNHGLNAAVNKLREALCDSAESPKYIETLPRRGYRFIADVATQEPESPTRAEPPPLVEVEPPLPMVPTFVPVDATRLSLRWPLRIGVAILMLAALAVLLSRHPFEKPYAPPSVKGDREYIASSNGRNEGPQFSPDGKKIAFMSSRGGAMDIWVCDANGKNPVQITRIGGTGTPRWSPDSRSIAFDARLHNSGTILVVSAEGGQPRFVVADSSESLVPSWSHDGKWIYFASDRSGDWQVWKTASEGGSEQQITRQGGFAPLESSDGRFIYYASSRYNNPQILRVLAGGGPETLVNPAINPGTWANWSLTDRGIFYVNTRADSFEELSYFDLKTNVVSAVATLDHIPFWLAVTHNGTRAAMDNIQDDASGSLEVLELQ